MSLSGEEQKAHDALLAVLETKEAVVSCLRRLVMAHSALYYELSTTFVTDHVFDVWCRILVHMQAKEKAACKKAVFAKEFKGFDGASGMHLARHPWAKKKAHEMIAWRQG